MAIIKKYPSVITDVQEHSDELFTLTLKSLKGVFKFHPGQFLHLALDEYDPSEAWPESRCFSMQSQPGSETIKITYSVKGRFTKRMSDQIAVGKMLTLKMPYGNLFDQQHSKSNTVFIAGGTGITPFLSLFLDEQFKAYDNPRLFAGFRKEGLNIFKDELDKALLINPSFRINYTIEEKDGILDIENIFKQSAKDAAYFISGPPIMISDFRNFLISNGVTENKVLADDWE